MSDFYVVSVYFHADTMAVEAHKMEKTLTHIMRHCGLMLCIRERIGDARADIDKLMGLILKRTNGRRHLIYDPNCRHFPLIKTVALRLFRLL